MGFCFKYFSTPMAWEDARSFCQDSSPHSGGDLASVPDDDTNNFLFTIIQNADVWIGGYRNENQDWVWSDGTPWEYESWHEDQPNDLGGMQTHVAFNFNSSAHWYDECKDEEKGFICYHKGM